MQEQIVLFLQGLSLSPEIITMVIAMLPIFELRGAIPIALWLELVASKAFLFAVIGNLIPIPFLLLLLGPVSESLRKYKLFDRFFDWLFQRTRRKSKLIERLELVGLVLFVAIPLPITGAWTGTVAAFLFDIPFKYAFPAIIIGVLIAGVIVTTASLGIIQLCFL